MKFLQRINSILSEDANSFANSFGVPRISPWIIQQYNKGHQSYKDYENIVYWVSNANPNIDGYDFYNAQQQANDYCNNIRQNGFNKYAELQSKNITLDFDNGKKWVEIGPEDCNAICHRLRYDCSIELKTVIDGNDKCYALQDPQDNTICIFINSTPHRLIGQFGNSALGCHQEIKDLCVRIGIDIIPEAYSELELPKALATKELDINNVYDLSSVMKKLSSVDILNCNLINYAHYSTVKSIYDLYNKTHHDCLLTYAMCHMIIYENTKSKAYQIIKSNVMNNNSVKKLFNKENNDNRYYIDLMDRSAEEISKIGAPG